MGVKPSVQTGSKPGASDHRVTTCSICRLGIFHGDATAWSRLPYKLGKVHAKCLAAEQAREVRP